MTNADWFKNAITYQILIDRFAGCKSTDWHMPRFLGGNLRGIIDKLVYIKELGINTVWLSPFYQTSEYHGYAVTNFFDIDPHFGTLDDLKELIRKTHAAGLRIIADFVPNHCSKHHPYFIEAQKDKNSQYYSWFYFDRWPHEYLCFLDVKGLPKLNLNNPATRDHITGAAKYWLSLGLDGFRLDHVIGPRHSFWRQFRRDIKADYPESVLIGEAWLEGVRYKHIRTIAIRNKHKRWRQGVTQDQVQLEYYRELDGILDFSFLNLVKEYFTQRDAPVDHRALVSALGRHFAQYPADYFPAIFLDNHDMNRFLFACNNRIENLLAAARLQFQFRQPVIIYYGTEVGMTQTHPVRVNVPNSDLQARQPMLWNRQNTDILKFYRELIRQRAER